MKCRAYLDIETTGLSWRYSLLTVVGIAVVRADMLEVVQLVGQQISANALKDALRARDVEEIYTYNGSRFDLPVIQAELKLDLKARFKHTDLMYACWRKNLKGGLKAVERQLGIERVLDGVDGFLAVRWWWQYVNNQDDQALAKLLQYNREDVVNLDVLRKKLEVE